MIKALTVVVALCATPFAAAALSINTVDQMLNTVRSNNGVASLQADQRLMATAQSHAQDMATNGYFSHIGRNGSNVMQRIHVQGYNACFAAENIAWGQHSESEVMQAWINSPGHQHNNVSPRAVAYGVGNVGDVWVLVFGRPC